MTTSSFPSRRAIAFCAGALFLLSLPVLAQPPAPPPFYAITNARVVTVSGGVLDRATVLVANGLIEEIGSDLEVPADAWIIDGEGMTLYPGLINALSELGLPSDESGPGGPPARGASAGASAPEIRGPQDRPSTTPWVNPADQLAADETGFDKWRKSGFTSVVTMPGRGLFPGQAALVNLGYGDPRDMIVSTPVAQRVNFRNDQRRSYPGSLMGVLSYVKQVLSDAQQYAAAQALYESSPSGRERPQYDRTLAPIHQALDTGLPFLMPAEHGRQIDRVLAIGREFGLNTVIYGAQGAWERPDTLRAENSSVVLDVDWPEPEKDRDPNADPDFRSLAHQRLAPSSARRLWLAGVPLAFTSSGSSPTDLLDGVRAAIEAGLPEEAALEALTLGAARIFGVDDLVGSIEVGKSANLVLADAPPWAEDVEVAAVFVDGRKFDWPESEGPAEAPKVDVSGTWALEMTTPRGTREVTATFDQGDDGKVKGEISGELGTTPIEGGRVSGETLTFTMSQNRGGRTFESSYTTTIADERLEGTVSAGPMSFEVAGTRTAAAQQGAELADSETGDTAGDESEVPEEEVLEGLRTYQGPVRYPSTFAIANATVWTLSEDEPVIEGATILVEDGRIAAVGTGVTVPVGTEVIDMEGGHVIPGIIDAHSHIAIEGGVNEGSLAVTAMVGIDDVVDPDDIGIYRALAGGVTSANLLHGSANPIGGRNQVIKLRWGADADGLRFEGAPPGIKFALGENPKRSRGGRPGADQRYPASRMGVMDVIRDAFVRAREYQKEWDEYETAVSLGGNPIPPRVDLELQTVAEILNGERLVHAHSYRADEILQLLRLCEEFGVTIATLQHVLEGYKVADEIAAHGAGASTFSDWWGYKVEAYDAIPYNAALMTQRGVLVSINSDSGEEMRHLNQEAAKTMHWGSLSEIEALKLVTLNPAKQLRVDDRVGTIEVGKDADLVLYDGHPLSVYSVVQKTFVDGDLYFDRDFDRERQAMIEDLEARLLGEDEAEVPESGAEPLDPTTTPDTTPITTPDSTPQFDPGFRRDELISLLSPEGSYSCRAAEELF